MKVLMFGWEFPPNNRGGLGTACYGLTKGLSNKGVDVVFVLPKGASKHSHLSMINANDLYIGNKKIRLRYLDTMLMPYLTESEYEASLKGLCAGNGSAGELYGKNLFEEVMRYAEKAKIISMFEDFDVIHCHDWMTYKAGIQAKQVSGKPLVVHVHATDFDRTGGNPNQMVYDIEREGMHAADRVIAVSNFTKNMIASHYGVSPDKVEVVHNAVEHKNPAPIQKLASSDKIVLFLGRVTLQKGPDYFMEAASRVLKIMPDVKFVVAGTGDMYRRMVDRAAELGIAKNVLFTGHLSGDDVDKAYSMADLYVMPSVSEPFGITPLEALRNNTPVIISRQSGVSEVLPNALRVDFWDIEEMTNKIIGVLNYSNLKDALVENGQMDIRRMSWDTAAEKCLNIYAGLTGKV
ncbi:glycosyltransferase family 4 protein [Candidatus Woesearchaeota archaeon]|nr:glycosyltransferase family 4 protein [Candidatus Woesearchaeota archaeon]